MLFPRPGEAGGLEGEFEGILVKILTTAFLDFPKWVVRLFLGRKRTGSPGQKREADFF
jgi:hypothetical protein